MTLDQALPKLVKLLPVLSSDKEGEIVATVYAINRILKSNKCDWHDLVKRLNNNSSSSGTTWDEALRRQQEDTIRRRAEEHRRQEREQEARRRAAEEDVDRKARQEAFRRAAEQQRHAAEEKKRQDYPLFDKDETWEGLTSDQRIAVFKALLGDGHILSTWERDFSKDMLARYVASPHYMLSEKQLAVLNRIFSKYKVHFN